MGNIVRHEKPQKSKENHNGIPEGVAYRSLLEISIKKERGNERNNNERPVKIDANSVNRLINMVHDNVISQNLIFKGPFGQRRCKSEKENILIIP